MIRSWDRFRALTLGGATALVAAGLIPAAPAAAAQEASYLVVYSSPASVDVQAVSRHGRVQSDLSAAGVLVVRSADPAGLRRMAGVTDVARDGIHFRPPKVSVETKHQDPPAGCATTDRACGPQWDLARINVPEAWEVTKGSPKVKVAVIDSGLNAQHEEAPSNYDLADSRSFVQPTPDCPGDVTSFSSLDDLDGHGTWVATHIAGRNGPQMSGIAPNTTLVNLRVTGSCGFAVDSWVFEAIMHANRVGARVINLSLASYLCGGGVVAGSYYCGDAASVGSDQATWHAMQAVIDHVSAHGSLVVAAAGNDHSRMGADGAMMGPGLVFGAMGPDPSNDLTGLYEWPAGLRGVIAVAATNRVTGEGTATETQFGQYGVGRHDQLANYSNYGAKIDVSAPGGARTYNVPVFDCRSANCGRLGPSNPTATDNPGAFGAFGIGCNSCYGYLQGSSIAAPQVAGVAALVLAAHPRMSAGALRQHLKRSVSGFASPNRTPGIANDPNAPTYNYDMDYAGPAVSNHLMGTGIINAAVAVGSADDHQGGNRNQDGTQE